jgi:hypothetical protein
MAHRPRLIVQVARGGAVDRQLSRQPPPSAAAGEVVIEVERATADGHLEPPAAGRVVLSVPSPETLVREAAEVRRVLAGAGSGAEPLVVAVEAAEELRDDELGAILEAAEHAPRPVILRILRDA